MPGFAEGVVSRSFIRKIFPLLCYYIVLARECFSDMNAPFPYEQAKSWNITDPISKYCYGFNVILCVSFVHQCLQHSRKDIGSEITAVKSCLQRLLHCVLCRNVLTLGHKQKPDICYRGTLAVVNYCIDLCDRYFGMPEFPYKHQLKFVKKKLIYAGCRLHYALFVPAYNPFLPISFVSFYFFYNSKYVLGKFL